jgi:hypothetical protein
MPLRLTDSEDESRMERSAEAEAHVAITMYRLVRSTG